MLNGEFASIADWSVHSTNPQGIVGYITSKLNYSKQCLTTDITSEGCKRGWPGLPPTNYYNQHNARWILPNGAKVQALNYDWWISGTTMVWTITAKAYADEMDFNTDTTLIACNVSDTTQSVMGITVKPGMCGQAGGSSFWIST